MDLAISWQPLTDDEFDKVVPQRTLDERVAAVHAIAVDVIMEAIVKYPDPVPFPAAVIASWLAEVDAEYRVSGGNGGTEAQHEDALDVALNMAQDTDRALGWVGRRSITQRAALAGRDPQLALNQAMRESIAQALGRED